MASRAQGRAEADAARDAGADSARDLTGIPELWEHTVAIHAPVERLWSSLTDLERMAGWMGEPEMEVKVETSWEVGWPITISGFHIVPFQSRGRIIEFDPPHRLSYTQLSSISRLPDEPDNHTTLAFTVSETAAGSTLTLSASGFPTLTIFKHVRSYWLGTLELLKKMIENASGAEAAEGTPGPNGRTTK